MRTISSRRAGHNAKRLGASSLALCALALCAGCGDDTITLLHVPASEGAPAALLSGTPIKVASCVRLSSAERPQGWALVFADDLDCNAGPTWRVVSIEP